MERHGPYTLWDAYRLWQSATGRDGERVLERLTDEGGEQGGDGGRRGEREPEAGT